MYQAAELSMAPSSNSATGKKPKFPPPWASTSAAVFKL
jgi:hypothetical protein